MIWDELNVPPMSREELIDLACVQIKKVPTRYLYTVAGNESRIPGLDYASWITVVRNEIDYREYWTTVSYRINGGGTAIPDGDPEDGRMFLTWLDPAPGFSRGDEVPDDAFQTWFQDPVSVFNAH